MTEFNYVHDLQTIANPSLEIVGGKGLGLWHLHRLQLTTPPAWVIPTSPFTEALSALGIGPLLAATETRIGGEPPASDLEAIRAAISRAKVPEAMLAQINRLRRQWREQFGDKVIVRSSATVEDSEHHAFPGIFDSIVCESDEQIANAIRGVWASVFSNRAFAYYGIASLDRFPTMALIIQPLVVADHSGVMFTKFPGPSGAANILIEYVEGDCEKLVQGEVDPNRLWLERWPSDGASFEETSGDLGSAFSFDLATAGQLLEDDFGRPQDVEWCVSGEHLYFVQTRAVTSGAQGTTAFIAGEVAIQGVGASPGRASGHVHLVFNIEDADALVAGDVLIATMTNPDMVPSMQRSAAVVTDVGGMICHAAIVSRELGIPCVVGTKSATQLFDSGAQVTVDGSSGAVFDGIVRPADDVLVKPDLQWLDLWDAWLGIVPQSAAVLLPTSDALATMPEYVTTCVLDPYCDLTLHPACEITALSSMEASSRRTLLNSYLGEISGKVAGTGLDTLYLDLHRLDSVTRGELIAAVTPAMPIVPLEQQGGSNPWLIQADAKGNQFALLDGMVEDPLSHAPPQATLTIPLGLGFILNQPVSEPPAKPEPNPATMFGMVPEIRQAPFPAKVLREGLHELIPLLSDAHGGQVPDSDEQFPWMDLRPEIVITPFLKAFVTPAVESIPHLLGFDSSPLHVQFINCRFHFRQDTLFAFLPAFLQATWREAFLSDLLQRSRASYEVLEARSVALPVSEDGLEQNGRLTPEEAFLNWWRAFCEFFALTFFIQAQGDDCVLPGLQAMVSDNVALLDNLDTSWRIPGSIDLTKPLSPVLTSNYIADLASFKELLDSLDLMDAATALSAIDSAEFPELNEGYERVRSRWFWMRERDPYYDPYDTTAAIVEKALGTGTANPQDHESNRRSSMLALALHYDLSRGRNECAKLVYGIKYGRALAIDRENHHIVWLKTSYRLRQLLLEWEGQLGAHSEIQHRDIFFLQPWEIIEAVSDLPRPMSNDLLAKVRNRRAAYEHEIQLKAGKGSTVTLQKEQDYY